MGGMITLFRCVPPSQQNTAISSRDLPVLRRLRRCISVRLNDIDEAPGCTPSRSGPSLPARRSSLPLVLREPALVRPYRAAISAAVAALCLRRSRSRSGADLRLRHLSARRAQAERLRRKERFPEALAAYQAVDAASETALGKTASYGRQARELDRAFADAEAGSSNCSRSSPTTRTAASPLPTFDGGGAATAARRRRDRVLRRARGRPAFDARRHADDRRSLGTPHWRGSLTVQDQFARTERRAGGEWPFRATPHSTSCPRPGGASGGDPSPRYLWCRCRPLRSAASCSAPTTPFSIISTPTSTRSAPTRAAILDGTGAAAARYRYASTSFSAGGPAVGNHAGSFTLGWLYGPANLVRLFGGLGGESFAGPRAGPRARSMPGPWALPDYIDPRLGLAADSPRQVGPGDGAAPGLLVGWPGATMVIAPRSRSPPRCSVSRGCSWWRCC